MTAAAEEVLARARARQLMRVAPATAKALRTQAGLTLQEVGDAIGVSRVSVYRWETGRRMPRGDLAVEYIAFLKRACGEITEARP